MKGGAFMPFILATATPDYQTVMSQINDTLTQANLTSVLVYAAGIAVGFVFFWWATRKVISIVKRAFMRGKLRL